jgi:Apea-like HEPN
MVAMRRLRHHTDDWTRATGPPEWRQNSDGVYRIDREPLVWDSDQVHQFTLLPQWSRIEEVVSNNSQLKAHFGHGVGSAYARSEINLEKILVYLLPRPIRSDDHNDILLDSSGFEGNYRALEDFLSANSVTQLTMWLVRGVELDKPIRFDDRTVMRKLSPLEIADCLRGGLLLPRHEIFLPNDPFEGAPVGLFLSRKEPKVFDTERMQADLDDFHKRIAEKQAAVETLQGGAALTDLPELSVGSIRAESHDWNGRLTSFISGGGVSIKFSLVHRLQSDIITPSRARLLRRNWSWLSGQTGNSNLTFAVRRLGYANERVRLEDHLLDTMIAAESLYLGGGKDTELKFRLAVHAAVWAEPAKLGATRQEIYEFMRKAYDARSKIAHGGEPRPSELKFKGNVIVLEEFCRILNDIVRMGLVKAISYTERNSITKFEPPWEKMILR